MRAQLAILPNFLNRPGKKPNPLEGFNMINFIEKFSGKLVDNCPICLNRCLLPTKTNKCNHVYCNKCITKWMKTKKKCPMCRRTFDKIIKLS